MAATIKIKNSSTASAVPTSSDLVQGELAVNVTDKRLFTENASGTVVELGTNPTILTMGAAGSASAPVITRTGDTNTGIFFPAADTIAFAEGGTETLRLDSSGNLGLGVTPSASTYKNFQINTTGIIGSASGYIWIGNNWIFNGGDKYIANGTAQLFGMNDGGFQWYRAGSGTAGNAISFTQAMTLDSSGRLGVGTTSPNTVLEAAGTIRASRSGSSGTYIELFGGSGAADPYINVPSGFGIPFLVAGTERARIDTSGNLLVGTTSVVSYIGSTTGALANVQSTNGTNTNAFVHSGSSNPYGPFIYYPNAAPNGTINNFLACQDSSAVRFAARSNGGLANYSANNVNLSDRREKTNFAPAGDYLAKICAIPVQTFNYIDQNLEEDDGLTLGVVAQDVQAVAPELVMESDWGTKEQPKMRLSIYQTDLQYALMKCIQEQQAIITQLQADVAALKG